MMLRLYLAAGALIALAASFWGWGLWQHHKGYSDATLEYETKLAAAQAEADGRAKAAEDRLAQVRAEADSQIAKLRASRPQARAQVKAITDANPEFAATARPDALAAQRLRELREVGRYTADDSVR